MVGYWCRVGSLALTHTRTDIFGAVAIWDQRRTMLSIFVVLVNGLSNVLRCFLLVSAVASAPPHTWLTDVEFGFDHGTLAYSDELPLCRWCRQRHVRKFYPLSSIPRRFARRKSNCWASRCLRGRSQIQRPTPGLTSSPCARGLCSRIPRMWPRSSLSRFFGTIYTWITNPTSEALEKRIAALEGGSAAVPVSYSHAAHLLAFSNILQLGDHFIATVKLCGGTYTQFGRQFEQFGWEVSFCGVEDLEGIEKSIRPKTKALHCEAVVKPGVLVVDLEKLASTAHCHGVPLTVDNTTATPYLVPPFEHGADVIVHSATSSCGMSSRKPG